VSIRDMSRSTESKPGRARATRTRAPDGGVPAPDAIAGDDAVPRALVAAAAALRLPLDAHVVGEPVILTQIRDVGRVRVGLRATCQRGHRAYDVSLADVEMPMGTPGADLVTSYRAWLGLETAGEGDRSLEPARPHKVDDGDITLGATVELLVLACKSNALRCRLLGTAREVTLRTAVRDEIPGAIVTVTPTKQWTHARHPYLSGRVSAVRFDAAVLGLVPLALHPEPERAPHVPGRVVYRLERVKLGGFDDVALDPVRVAREMAAAGDRVAARELWTNVLVVDRRCLEAHADLGDDVLRYFSTQAMHHYQLGAAIGGLSVGAELDGELPWEIPDNRAFLRCLQGMARALVRLHRRDEAADTLRRLLRLDPSDSLGARDHIAAIEAGESWEALQGTGTWS
jgi:hypothetical protein